MTPGISIALILIWLLQLASINALPNGSPSGVDFADLVKVNDIANSLGELSKKSLAARDSMINKLSNLLQNRRRDTDVPDDASDDVNQGADDTAYQGPLTKEQTITKHEKWLFQPPFPHQWYKCEKKDAKDQSGLRSSEIKEVAAFLVHGLNGPRAIPIYLHQTGCKPIFCQAPFSLVTICNNRPNSEKHALSIPGEAVGRLIWEMAVYTELDDEWLRLGLRDNKIERPCREGTSEMQTDPSRGSFVVSTGWSDDQWDIVLSKSDCNAPDLQAQGVAVNAGRAPAGFPRDFYNGVNVAN